MSLLLLLLCFTLSTLHYVTTDEVHFYVSVTGNDSRNEGRNITQPCRTLRHAVLVASNNKYKNDTKIIELLPGYHDITRTVGVNTQNLVIRAYQKQEVHVTGGLRIPSSAFKQVTDQTILSKFTPIARQHVRVVNLPSVNIKHYGSMSLFGTCTNCIPKLEVSFNGKAMRIAQWPNKGYIDITATPGGVNGNTFKYNSTVPKSWLNESNPWIQGFLHFNWHDEAIPVSNLDANTMTVTLGRKTYRGVIPGQWNTVGSAAGFFKFINILSALDEEGEYYIDKDHGNLYIWVPNTDGNVKSTDVVYGSMIDNCINLGNALKNVTFKDFTLESCRQTGINGGGQTELTLINLEIKNTGYAGIHLIGAKNIRIAQCLIHDVNGGIELTGGNRQLLESSGNIIEDNEIYDFTRLVATGMEGIYMRDIGHIVRNNHIHHGESKAIYYEGNDFLIEHNLIHDVCVDRYTCDGIATSRGDFTMRGTIIRSNIIHDIRGLELPHINCRALTLDIHSSGNVVTNNVFYNNDIDINIVGGMDNTITDNVLYNATRYSIYGIRRNSQGRELQGLLDHLHNMPYHNADWALRYPKLANIDSRDFNLPAGNDLSGNIVYIEGPAQYFNAPGSKWDAPEYYNISTIGYSTGPGDHFNVKNGDFRVKCTAAEWANKNNFQQVPSPNEVGPNTSPLGPTYLQQGFTHTVNIVASSSVCSTMAPVTQHPVPSYLPDGSDLHIIFNVSKEGCWLVVTKCTKHSSYVGTYRDMFGERFKHAGESEEMCFRRAVSEWNDCGKHTSEPVAAIYGPTGATTFAGDGCFIAEYGCPQHGGPADGHAITAGKIYRDVTAEQQYNASTNETNCLSQALTRWKYCGSSPNHPVTMIYRPTGAIRTAGAGCWIHTDVCPSRPEYKSMFYDAWGSTNRHTDSIQTACLNQAEYYWHLCGSDKDSPVTAYYRPTTASKTFP
ncbi:hypothetical protein ACF0H5_023081 [Mactra antiquata]